MKDEADEPRSWQYLDNSPLPVLLRYDILSPNVAIPLLCNIDQDRSELFSDDLYFGLNDPAVQEAMTLSGQTNYPAQDWMNQKYPEYWRMRLLSDDPENCPRCWYESLAGISKKCARWRDELSDGVPPPFGEVVLIEFDVSHQLQSFDRDDIAEHIDAQRIVNQAWEIYFSNPRHDIDDPNTIIDENDFNARIGRSPKYFIDWAESKGFEISWLDWASERGYIDGPAQVEILDKRERDSLVTLIGALLQALNIDPIEHGVIKKIKGFTVDYGARIGTTALSNILRKIPVAKETVQQRKNR